MYFEITKDRLSNINFELDIKANNSLSNSFLQLIINLLRIKVVLYYV